MLWSSSSIVVVITYSATRSQFTLMIAKHDTCMKYVVFSFLEKNLTNAKRMYETSRYVRTRSLLSAVCCLCEQMEMSCLWCSAVFTASQSHKRMTHWSNIALISISGNVFCPAAAGERHDESLLPWRHLFIEERYYSSCSFKLFKALLIDSWLKHDTIISSESVS